MVCRLIWAHVCAAPVATTGQPIMMIVAILMTLPILPKQAIPQVVMIAAATIGTAMVSNPSTGIATLQPAVAETVFTVTALLMVGQIRLRIVARRLPITLVVAAGGMVVLRTRLTDNRSVADGGSFNEYENRDN